MTRARSLSVDLLHRIGDSSMASVRSHDPLEPSKSAQRAAKAAADSPHALINLGRLVRSLEEKSADDLDTEVDADESGWRALELKKDMESVAYARALLGYLQGNNQQSSSSGAQLSALEAILYKVKKRYRSSSRTRKPSLSPRTSFKKQDSLLMSTQDAALPATISPSPELAQPGQVDDPSSQAAATGVTTDSGIRQRKRQAPSLEEYLAARKREDQADGETGLLPIKRPTTASGSQAGSGLGARDKLFDGVRPGMGSAQMHEELGGQLADMSRQLKLNAMHFSNALEQEKALLDTSTGQLENNLASTQKSKKHLGTVSSKSRGTTCMTLGIVLLVLIIFVWTYMLIRFT